MTAEPVVEVSAVCRTPRNSTSSTVGLTRTKATPASTTSQTGSPWRPSVAVSISVRPEAMNATSDTAVTGTVISANTSAARSETPRPSHPIGACGPVKCHSTAATPRPTAGGMGQMRPNDAAMATVTAPQHNPAKATSSDPAVVWARHATLRSTNPGSSGHHPGNATANSAPTPTATAPAACPETKAGRPIPSPCGPARIQPDPGTESHWPKLRHPDRRFRLSGWLWCS